MNVRTMYHECRLVHGDLSEYNMLYHQGDAFIIDVSQSVEHDHPHALEFLRKDLCNVTQFFGKFSVAVLGLRELFDWVVDTRPGWEQRLDSLETVAASRSEEERSAQQLVDEEVFKQVFIPRRLNEVAKYDTLQWLHINNLQLTSFCYRPERDIKIMKTEGNLAEGVEYSAVTGLNDQNSVNGDLSEHSSGDEDDGEGGDNVSKGFVSARRPKEETKEEKAERKKAVKDAKADKRKDKVPKHVKKRKEKSTKNK